jgi:hypothetical protein
MPLLLRNNFSSGPDGTAITTVNSGLGDDDPWAAIGHSGASGWKVEYDLAPDRPTAEYVGLLQTTTPTSTAVVAWSVGTITQVYWRMYVYFSVAPNNVVSSPIFYVENATGNQLCIVGVNSAGSNELFGECVGATQSIITTGGITAGQWFRVEGRVKAGVSTGELDLYWFNDPDSDTPTESLFATGWPMNSTTLSGVYFGYVFPQLDLEPLRLSGIEVNDSRLPGPAPWRQGKGVPTGALSSPTAPHTFTVA